MYVPDWPAFAAALLTLGDLVVVYLLTFVYVRQGWRHRSTLERLERLMPLVVRSGRLSRPWRPGHRRRVLPLGRSQDWPRFKPIAPDTRLLAQRTRPDHPATGARPGRPNRKQTL